MGMRIRGARPLIHRADPHLPHQPPDTPTAHTIPLTPQMPRHLTAPVIGRKQKLRVNQFNEKLSIITTGEDQIGSIPAPRIHVCGQATNATQLEEVNADGASEGFLAKQKERLNQKEYLPVINAILSPNSDQREQQLYQSPVMEMIQSIRRFQSLQAGDRLIIISDLIQNSDSVQFCRTQNDMPSFSEFVKRPIYARLKPDSLEGIEAEVLMLQRTGYGRSNYAFCRSEEELRRFWQDYLIANGVKNPSFIRIRHGIVGG